MEFANKLLINLHYISAVDKYNCTIFLRWMNELSSLTNLYDTYFYMEQLTANVKSKETAVSLVLRL